MFKKLRQSFTKKVFALIILFSVILIFLFIGMTYYTTKSNLLTNVTETIKSASSSADTALSNYITRSALPLKIFANDNDLISHLSDPASTNSEAVAANLEQLANSYNIDCTVWCISDLTGDAIVNNGTAEKIITDDYLWYREMSLSGTTTPKLYFKSEQYEDFLEFDTELMMVEPVYNNGVFVGCLGLELSSSDLAGELRSSIRTEGIFSIIADNFDNLVCTSATAEEYNHIFSDSEFSPNELIRNDATEFASDKVTHYSSVSSVSTGWKTIVIYDGRILDNMFAKMYLQQIIILACLFILELIATLNVIRHESKDIPEISSSIAEISAGNYNFRINSSSVNEIGLIAKSVDNLAQTLQDKNAVIDDYTNLDPTTGLQNRYKMYEYIEDLMVSRDETRKRFALLFIDIDNFKWITETLGHRQGDEFLRIFGQRLKSVVPKVFRFSGDEFIILTEFNDDFGIIDEVVANLRAEFREPIQILNDKLYVHFSIGISIFPDDESNADMLLRDADIAMSRAKEKGKGRVSFYNADLHRNVLSKATISQKLNKALENNEMFLNFQPIISVQNGDIHGFEVLIRWESDELGFVSPGVFVQIAEETGAIVEIGTWIFETACRYLKKMCEYKSDIIMSINVSPVQLRKSDFLDKIKRTINVFGINPANIQVEITETSFVEFMDGSSNLIQEIHDMGIAIALDDFGTGYSSFGYLKDMPISCLKVDKSFVDEICSKHKDYQITGSIIDMVRNLGIKTVVEGVESIEQYQILSEMKCDYIQGFLMSKPLNANDALEFVEKYNELHKPNQQVLEENSSKLAAERKSSAK